VEGFSFVWSQPVVLRDLDAFGHVNNAVYLTYVENGRVDYFRAVLGIERPEDLHNIMASVTLNYRSPVSYGESVHVGVRTERIGDKSLTLYYELRADDDRLVADATTVQVAFDYAEGRAVPVPEHWRRRLAEFEGPALEAPAPPRANA
jgi:acyl-CoA thioester hydrolase